MKFRRQLLLLTGRSAGWIPGFFELVLDRFTKANLRSGKVNRSWFGYKIEFDLADYTRRKAYFDSFERRELKYVARSLSVGGLAIDVGANVGLLSLAMARSVGVAGRVISFEPVSSNFDALVNAVKGIPQVEVRKEACGESSGKTIQLSRISSSGSDDAGTSGSFGIGGDGTDAVEVPLVALDDVLRKSELESQQIQLLKADVEGAEIEVLRGAGKALRSGSIKSILLEAALTRDGFREEDIKVMTLLSEYGYKVHPISIRGKRMKCNLENYPRRFFGYPRWALKYTSTISLNYCAVR